MTDARFERTPGRPTRLFGLDATARSAECSLRQVLDEDLGYAASVRRLAELVGGIDALESLSDDPLPSEQIDAAHVDARHCRRVEDVLSTIDDFAGQFLIVDPLDGEYRTIITLVIRRLLDRSPTDLMRPSTPRVGAALTWLAMRGNGALHGRRSLSAADIWDGFGVSSATELGRRLHRSAGLAPPPDPDSGMIGATPVWLGDVALLHSRTRRLLLDRREALLEAIRADRRRRHACSPVRRVADDRVALEATPTIPRWAIRVVDTSGRHVVIVTCGHDEDDPQVLGFTVPDAHDLVRMLQRALAHDTFGPAGADR